MTTTSERVAANEIRLSGYLSAPPDIKELESGATIVLLRVVVRRPDGERIDSLPVAVGPHPRKGERRAAGQAAARTVKRAATLDEGDEVVVSGWLQRRFWDAGGQRRSRLQVVAETVARA
jgi:single-strand DNA-binding protein